MREPFRPVAGPSCAFLSTLSQRQCAEGRDAGKGLADLGDIRASSGPRTVRPPTPLSTRRGASEARGFPAAHDRLRHQFGRRGGARGPVDLAAAWPRAGRARRRPACARRIMITVRPHFDAAIAMARAAGAASARGVVGVRGDRELRRRVVAARLPVRSRSMSSRRGSPRRSRSGSAASTASRSAAPCWSATRSAARRCACATSWCATRRAPWSRARRRPRSGLAGLGLLTGRVQTDRLSLIGAEMALRIEPERQRQYSGRRRQAARPDYAGHRPARSRPPARGAGRANVRGLPPVEVTTDPLAAVLAWIDKLDSLGLDGGSLSEIGLKDCTLVVDDQRHGKRWTFEHINLSLTRPREAASRFAVNSTGADGLWSLTATVTPKPDGRRTIETVVRDVSPKDLMLALARFDGHFSADMPLSAVVRAEIERDGTLQALEGRILAGRRRLRLARRSRQPHPYRRGATEPALESRDASAAAAARRAVRAEPGQFRRAARCAPAPVRRGRSRSRAGSSCSPPPTARAIRR